MKDVLAKALAQIEDRGSDRILAASFFRPRPMQAGAAPVIRLDERRSLVNEVRGSCLSSAEG